MTNHNPTDESCAVKILKDSLKYTDREITDSKLVKDIAIKIARDLKWIRDRGPNISKIKSAAMLHKAAYNNKGADLNILKELGHDETYKTLNDLYTTNFNANNFATEREIILISAFLVNEAQPSSVKLCLKLFKPCCPDEIDFDKLSESILNIKTSIERETQKNIEEMAVSEL